MGIPSESTTAANPIMPAPTSPISRLLYSRTKMSSLPGNRSAASVAALPIETKGFTKKFRKNEVPARPAARVYNLGIFRAADFAILSQLDQLGAKNAVPEKLKNWAGNVTYGTENLVSAKSVAEVKDCLRKTGK